MLWLTPCRGPWEQLVLNVLTCLLAKLPPARQKAPVELQQLLAAFDALQTDVGNTPTAEDFETCGTKTNRYRS